MEIPQGLREALEDQLTNMQRAGMNQARMIDDAQTVSLRYRTQSGSGERLLTRDNEAVAYAAARMPATYGAISTALDNALSVTDCSPATLFDAGAGTGAASWAASRLLNLESILCLEREDAMIKTGKALMAHGTKSLQAAKWKKHDLVADELTECADLVIAAYVFNEMSEKGRLVVLEKLWDATAEMLLIIEPGTPTAFTNLLTARKTLLEGGAHLVAPCLHSGDCPKMGKDWCHFSCRVARSRIHRQMKGGQVPYEDEKYTYMAFTRNRSAVTGARVLRHPQVRGGHVMLEVCSQHGVQNIKLTKKDGEKYKQARKAKAGDRIELAEPDGGSD